MMTFTDQTPVREIVVANPSAVEILEQAGVDYCCGGEKSLADACNAAGVSLAEIAARLHQNGTKPAPDADWSIAPLARLAAYIVEKHHGYVRGAIQRLQPLLAKVRGKHGANHPELAGIESLFQDVSREMTQHMQKEEYILFPYIEEIERAAHTRSPMPPPPFGTVRHPIRMMMDEHDAAAAIVKEIRSRSSAYAPPADACMSFQAAYRELHTFETDLHQHVHLENNILFPRAIEMEDSLV